MTGLSLRRWMRTVIVVAITSWAAMAPAQQRQSQQGMYPDRLSTSSQDQVDMDDGQDTPTLMQPTTQQRDKLTSPTSAGHTARSQFGEVGQRQTREDVFQQQAQPMARIDSRINNRVQSRLRTRIDQTYDPQANATSPFEVATEQTRAVGRPSRR